MPSVFITSCCPGVGKFIVGPLGVCLWSCSLHWEALWEMPLGWPVAAPPLEWSSWCFFVQVPPVSGVCLCRFSLCLGFACVVCLATLCRFLLCLCLAAVDYCVCGLCWSRCLMNFALCVHIFTWPLGSPSKQSTDTGLYSKPRENQKQQKTNLQRSPNAKNRENKNISAEVLKWPEVCKTSAYCFLLLGFP